jgi:hypothetical protein
MPDVVVNLPELTKKKNTCEIEKGVVKYEQPKS